MTHDAAVKWINAEKGVSGNVLGLKDASGHFYTYSSQEAGLRAAAGWVKTGPAWTGYPAIVSSLASGDTMTQLRAIAASKWNGSRYPAWGFGFTSKTTSVANLAQPITGGNGGLATLASAPVGTMYGVTLDGTPFTYADVKTMMTNLQSYRDAQYPNGLFTSGGPLEMLFGTGVAAQLLVTQTLEKRLNQPKDAALATALQTDLGLAATKAGTGGGIIPPEITAAFVGLGKGTAFFLDGQNWTYLIALVVGVPLALIGFYLLAGVPTQGQNA
jgi:hypothetical protein